MKIVDSIFKYNHSKSRARDLAFRFINTVLEMNEEKILEEYRIQTFYSVDEASTAAASARLEN